MSAAEKIIAAAMRKGDVVFSVPQPGRHHTIYVRLDAIVVAEMSEADQGFLTSAGRFVDRIDGLRIATEAGQIIHKHGNPDMLFSEDMW